MNHQLYHCMVILCTLVSIMGVEGNNNIETNNKCTYSANKRILNCVYLENAEDLSNFITPRTQMLFLRNCNNVNFRTNHHANPNYSHLASYQILNSRYFSAESGAFLGLDNLRHMEIHGNLWTDIVKNTFLGLTNLEVLNLANNQIKRLNEKSFNQLRKLKTLDLSDNSLEIIPSYVFEGLEEIESLYINNNLIKVLQEYSFIGLSSLKVLYLTNNSVEYIDTTEVNRLKSLEHLNINFNNIKSIIGQFDLPKLQFLQMSNNQLREIGEDTFEKCSDLMSIDLSRNSLTSLTEVPFLNLKKLKHLNLKANKVDFSKFSNCNKFATIIYN